MPSAGSDSISSYFVLAMFSIEPNVSRCCGPTLVKSPYFGRTSSHNSRMSPTCRAPISAMNSSCSGLSCSLITRERPIGVLKLAGVASTRYFCESMSRSTNFVEVFP